MKLLNLMKTYCEHLFESDEPESKAMYQVLLPAVVRCETKAGDTIECKAEDLVHEVIDFMHTELEMPEMARTNIDIGATIEDTIEFVIKTLLAQRKE